MVEDQHRPEIVGGTASHADCPRWDFEQALDVTTAPGTPGPASSQAYLYKTADGAAAAGVTVPADETSGLIEMATRLGGVTGSIVGPIAVLQNTAGMPWPARLVLATTTCIVPLIHTSCGRRPRRGKR